MTTYRLSWHRIVAGVYRASTDKGIYSVQQVALDDGNWWIVVYPDGQSGEPTQYLATAKRWAEDDALEDLVG
jgi:hypothetical protein